MKGPSVWRPWPEGFEDALAVSPCGEFIACPVRGRNANVSGAKLIADTALPSRTIEVWLS